MHSQTEAVDLSCEYYPEGGLMRCIGFTPRARNSKIEGQLKSHYIRNKALSKIEIRRESVTVASQREFKFEKPLEIVGKNRKTRVSVGFFMNNQFRGRIVNHTPKKKPAGCKSQPQLNINQQLLYNLKNSAQNHEEQVSQAEKNFQKLVKLKERLRRCHHLSKRLVESPSNKQERSSFLTNLGSPKHFNLQAKVQNKGEEYSHQSQKFQLMKSFKKAHVLKSKRTFSKLESNVHLSVKANKLTKVTRSMIFHDLRELSDPAKEEIKFQKQEKAQPAC